MVAFVETVLKGLLRTFDKQALIANLKPLLQATLHKNNLVWEDVQPILETIDSVDELKAAVADPGAFLSRLSDLGGPAAVRLLIAMLKKPMVPVLAERGLDWRDVLPALQLVDSMDELKAAAADPAAFLLQHLVISGSGPSRCISFNIPSRTFALAKVGPSKSLVGPSQTLVQKYETLQIPTTENLATTGTAATKAKADRDIKQQQEDKLADAVNKWQQRDLTMPLEQQEDLKHDAKKQFDVLMEMSS